ncbi:YaaC family protein [Terrilactibacillus sp. S3-3]|nr:YaaC family protein [Terrilactibacillus sp. S3-3]
MTADRFKSFLAPYGLLVSGNRQLKELTVKLNSICRPADHQLLQMTIDHDLFFPSQRDDLNLFPEAMVHYLVLYNLSMICRYETEWWYDLHFQRASADIAFIKQFLDISSRKIPAILLDFITMMEENS